MTTNCIPTSIISGYTGNGGSSGVYTISNSNLVNVSASTSANLNWNIIYSEEFTDRNGTKHSLSREEIEHIVEDSLNEKVLREEHQLLNDAYKNYQMLLKIYNSVEGLLWIGMHCVSSYPCGPEHANLPRLSYLSNLCKNLGYSDHTSDVVTPSISLAFGSRVVEKHFTIDKDLPGRDNKFALDPTEFSQMVANIRIAEKSCFDHGPEPREIEKDTMRSYRGRWGD